MPLDPGPLKAIGEVVDVGSALLGIAEADARRIESEAMARTKPRRAVPVAKPR